MICLQTPVVADLPVGNNLQDHLYYDYQMGVQEPVSVTPEQFHSWWSWLQYTLFKTGRYTAIDWDKDFL